MLQNYNTQIITFRSKACKKELWQKIMASTNQAAGETSIIPTGSSSPSVVPISTANANQPNIGGPTGAVGGLGAGATQNSGIGSGSNLQQPPPQI